MQGGKQSAKGYLGLGEFLAERLHHLLVRQPASLLLDAAVVFLDEHGKRVGGARGGGKGCSRSVPAILCEKLEASTAASTNFCLDV